MKYRTPILLALSLCLCLAIAPVGANTKTTPATIPVVGSVSFTGTDITPAGSIPGPLMYAYIYDLNTTSWTDFSAVKPEGWDAMPDDQKSTTQITKNLVHVNYATLRVSNQNKNTVKVKYSFVISYSAAAGGFRKSVTVSGNEMALHGDHTYKIAVPNLGNVLGSTVQITSGLPDYTRNLEPFVKSSTVSIK